MGDEGTLVDHLLLDVKHPVSWRYMFHLLCSVQDPDVKESIKTKLLSRVNRQNDPIYANFIAEISSPQYLGASISRNVSEELQIEKRMRAAASNPAFDLVETADAQTQKLFFWNALETYRELNRVRDGSHFYSERAILHIVLDEWPEALSLATKSGNVELLSVLGSHTGIMGFPVNDLIGLLDDQDMRDASEALRAFLKCSFQSAIWTVHDCQFLSKGAKDLRPEILRQMSLSA